MSSSGPGYFAIGADELKVTPRSITAGDRIRCRRCGEIHELKHGTTKTRSGQEIESSLIQFYRCGKKSFMAGFDGRIMEKGLEVLPKDG